MNTGQEIKAFMKERGITQSFLSRRTGISQPTLGRKLNGERRFKTDEYALICGVLGVNTDFFVKPKAPEEVS